MFALTNSGLIEGGKGGTGPKGSGAQGDAIYSAGAHASIGSIANTGRIVGNVVIDDQASVTVTGGSGKTFGRWTGGAITIGAGSLTFASGNTALGDDISVDGGDGTVINRGALRVTAPETIDRNFTQSKAGVLDLDFAGDVSGQYGALTVRKLTTLDGGLAIDLTNGFTLGGRRDLRHPRFRQPRGRLHRPLARRRGLLFNGRGHVDLRRRRASERSDRRHVAGLFVAHAPAVFGPSSSPIPEPSTWAMLGLGFLGFGGLRLMGRGRPAPS